MTGLPTLSLKLDDGTGSYPYDITSFGRWADGWSFNRGRGDENSEVQTGTLNVVLDNTDGRFTLGNVTYGITTDRLVQLKETVGGTPYTRYTGYIETIPTEWPDGGDAFAVARLVAVDRLARLGRRTLKSIIENEILLDAATAYYTLAEPTGSLSAGDTSGNGQPTLVLAGDPAFPVVFGSATGPATDSLTAAQFAGGQFLTTQLTLASGFTVEGTVLRTGVPAGRETFFDISGILTLAIDTSGKMTLSVSGGAPTFTSTLVYADGATHTWAVTVSSGNAWTFYIDGVSMFSSVISAISGLQTLNVGGALGVTLTGTMSHIAVFGSVLTAPRVLAYATAMLTGFVTDRADQRIARLASYAKIAVGDQNLETGQQPSIAVQTTSGGSVLAAIQAVAQAEGGVAFILGDGKLGLHNKSHRPLKATGAAAIALTADQVNPDLSFGGEKSYLYNTATGSRNGGATQRSINAASVALYEEYPVDRSVALLPTDELVLNMLTWLTTMYSSPRTRLGALTLDLMTLPQATVQALLALEIGDRITVGSLPAQSPVSTADLILEGLSERQSTTEWALTLNTVPSAVYVGWILQDATYGQLDVTTRLYF